MTKSKGFCRISFLLLLIITLNISCTSTPFHKTSEGYILKHPLDINKLEKSIILSLSKFNWRVTEHDDGQIIAQYSKSNDLIIAIIQIDFSNTGYEITYINSKNLDVNLKRMTIHKNYNRWIANLNKSIYGYYNIDF